MALSGINRAQARISSIVSGSTDSTRLTPSVLSHREAGVIAALPMQEQLDLVVLDACHDLAQHDTDDALRVTAFAAG